MARYIDVDKFTERIKASPAFRNIYDGLLLQRVVIDLLNNIPTADVVPKEFLTRKEDEAYARGYAEAKTEVAREIFEEIFTKCVDYYGYIEQPKLADLKKKYTEEKE